MCYTNSTGCTICEHRTQAKPFHSHYFHNTKRYCTVAKYSRSNLEFCISYCSIYHRTLFSPPVFYKWFSRIQRVARNSADDALTHQGISTFGHWGKGGPGRGCSGPDHRECEECQVLSWRCPSEAGAWNSQEAPLSAPDTCGSTCHSTGRHKWPWSMTQGPPWSGKLLWETALSAGFSMWACSQVSNANPLLLSCSSSKPWDLSWSEHCCLINKELFPLSDFD